MPGSLFSGKDKGGDANLTGGAATSTSSAFQQADREVRRSTHSDRPQRTGTFEVDGRPPTAKKVNQKSPVLTNLRSKAVFKRRRLRK